MLTVNTYMLQMAYDTLSLLIWESNPGRTNTIQILSSRQTVFQVAESDLFAGPTSLQFVCIIHTSCVQTCTMSTYIHHAYMHTSCIAYLCQYTSTRIIIIILVYFYSGAYTGRNVIEPPINCDRRCITKLVNSHRRISIDWFSDAILKLECP